VGHMISPARPIGSIRTAAFAASARAEVVRPAAW
jgi:hypothetical protein